MKQQIMRIFWSKVPPPQLLSTLNSNLLMISLNSVLSGSRRLAWPWAAIHAVTFSRRHCLTVVWSAHARSYGMCTLGGEWWWWWGGHRGTGTCPSLPCKCQFSHTGGKPIILQKKKKSLLSFKMFYRQCNTILTEG